MLSLLIAITLIFGILSVTANAQADTKQDLLDAGAAVSTEINREGTVLMKNKDNSLPLKKGTKVAVFGEAQHMSLYTKEKFNTEEESISVNTLTYQHGYIPWGAGSSRSLGDGGVNAKYDPLDALRDAEKEGRIDIYDPLSDSYAAALDASTHPSNFVEYVPDDAMYTAASEFADTALVFLSRWDGECIDMNGTATGVKLPEWELTAGEKTLLQTVSAKFENVVVLLNTPGPIDTSWSLEGNTDNIDVDAMLFLGYGGMQGGNAVADILLGKVNPSGKLVDTWAKSINDYPTTETFLNDNSYQNYTEDIYLGYRYFETFNIPVNYPFGFGLSYTEFKTETSDFRFENGNISVKAKVTNIGAFQGKQVVQMYVSQPQGVLGKPSKVLCAFAKTGNLLPGASEELTLTVKLNDLASYDDIGKTAYKSAYVLEAGDYKFYVGDSVKNVSHAGTFAVNELTLVEQLSEQCPTNLEKRLLHDGTYEMLTDYSNENNVIENGTLTVQAENNIGFVPRSSAKEAIEAASSAKLYNPETKAWEPYSCKAESSLYSCQYLYYKVTAPEAGKYKLTARIATHNKTTATMTFALSYDNVTYTNAATVTQADTATPGGNQYNSYIDSAASGTLDLHKGDNYIRVSFGSGEAAPNFDSFTLTDVVPYLEHGKSATVSAVDYYATTAVLSGEGSYVIANEITAAKKYLYNDATGEYEEAPNIKYLCNTSKNYTVTYRVNVVEAGLYGISAVGATNKNVPNPAVFKFAISTDNVTFTDRAEVVIQLTHTESGSAYYGFRSFDSEQNFYLSEGTYYIKVSFANAANFSSFTLKGVSIPRDGSIRIGVENYTAMHAVQGSSFHLAYGSGTVNGGASKNCYSLDSMWNNGNYAEYTVIAPYTGSYKLSLCQSTGRDTDYVMISSSVDGVNYTSGVRLNCPGNGAWNKFVDTAPVTVELKEGKNIIRIASLGVAPNIQSFVITGKTEMSYFGSECLSYGDNSSPTATYHFGLSENNNGRLYDEVTGTWKTYNPAPAFENWWVGGSNVIFKADAPLAGEYTLKLRIATWDTSVTSIRYAVSYDNTAWTSALMQDIPVTYGTADGALGGTVQNFSYVDAFAGNADLKKGSNFIKISVGSGTAFNLAGIVLELNEAAQEQEENFVVVEPPAKDSYYQLSDVVKGTVTMDEFVAQMTTSELASFFVSSNGFNGAGPSKAACSKYGISGANFSDGPSGLSTVGTSYPCETTIASTWNTELAKAFGLIVGRDAENSGVDLWAAPAMNLHRNPLAGRNSEYYSEDQFITAEMAKATVIGSQTSGTVAVLKHFVCNEKEANKLSSDSRVSERALRELYLKPFERCIKEADARGLMSSYNILNGIPVTENYDLLTNIVRKEWGYKYFISGDWNNTKDEIKEINAGNGVRQPASYCNIENIIAAIQAGRISRETLETGAKYELNTLKLLNRYYNEHGSELCNGNHTFVDGACTACGMTDGNINISAIVTPLMETGEYASEMIAANVTVGETLTENIYVALTPEQLEDASVTFTRNGKTVTVTEPEYSEDFGMYYFAYTGITPQCMNDTVKSVLKVGGEIVEEKEWSVKSYLETLYGLSDTPTELKNLCAAMLRYGAAAQEYMDYNTENPANESTVIDFASYGLDCSVPEAIADIVTVSGDENNKVTAATLVFDNVNKIRFTVTKQNGAKVFLNGVEVTPEENGYVYTKDIFANGYDEVFTVAVKVGDTVKSEVHYNVNTYLNRKWDSPDAKLQKLVRATAVFGSAAKAYDALADAQ